MQIHRGLHSSALKIRDQSLHALNAACPKATWKAQDPDVIILDHKQKEYTYFIQHVLFDRPTAEEGGGGRECRGHTLLQRNKVKSSLLEVNSQGKEVALLKRLVQDGRAALQLHTERDSNECDLLGAETAQGGIACASGGAILKINIINKSTTHARAQALL